ncbi:MAG: hypothetical protein HC834_03860 [Rhodospirillales bacterium]|nr:hypothetical protein [Rhodospirillales bacterium]
MNKAIRSVRRSSVIRLCAAVLMLIAGAAILFVAAPRTIAAVVSGAGEPIIRQINKHEDVSAQDLQTVIDAQRRGLFWAKDADMEMKLGLAHMLLAEKQAVNDPARAIHLEQARQALRTSVARAPANPYPWTLLAYTEFLITAKWAEPAIAALRMSILTGPHEPRMVWSRLRLSLIAWDSLGEQDRDLVMEQLRYAWELEPDTVVKLVQNLNATNLLRAALIADKEASAELEDRLRQANPDS